MKRALIVLAAVVIVAVRLLQLVREPSEPLAAVVGPRHQVSTGTATLTSRVDVPTDKPVEMGLPVWTNVLPTMPALPPPVDTQPPAVPAAALR